MVNILKDIPYKNEGLGRRKLVDEKHMLIMQIALQPGQMVPRHNANSNVNLLVVEGEITANLDGLDHEINEGDLFPVAYGTRMIIKNSGNKNASFLVIKTPNPSEMG